MFLSSHVEEDDLCARKRQLEYASKADRMVGSKQIMVVALTLSLLHHGLLVICRFVRGLSIPSSASLSYKT